MDQLNAARALGIPIAACIMSWDHLSSKALVHIAPDATIVWNDVQKQEAVGDARTPAERRRHRRAVLRPVVRQASGAHRANVLPRRLASIRRARSCCTSVPR